MPLDESSGVKELIVQVPIVDSECYQLPDILKVDSNRISWVSPVQICVQYTDVPAPGFTFTLGPNPDGKGQWLYVWYKLHRVAIVAIGGPHGRIVVGSNLVDETTPADLAEVINQVTIAFLVHIKETHEDDTNTGLLQQGSCIGTV
ncbi:hypothetical protein MZD04_gp292 [Pseudomonas phage Psa21]|uniref:Uncharacterized protein n=1 Tax=Pseudomonas phage Psa21 TaxID=2530023 RepID=A0A481W537_9CAUD|nr:hypothetical protein MZD04_gp292 [Pseudomonas phage Psa21]QBJ02818.1 hypothetical protein PSA21_292 [Pseudomonas phage Psa21]